MSKIPFFWISVVLVIGGWLLNAYNTGAWPFSH